MEEMIYWIWLSLACSPGSTTFGKLIKEFPGAREIYEDEGRKIASVIGYRTSDRTALADKSLDRAKEILSYCKRLKVGILTYADPIYPERLREISNPPVLLYYRGNLPDFNSKFYVGIVGTRKLSDYGRKNAFRFGYDLAAAGSIIVSGMAEGIDGVAMAGALAAGGSTVAVIGSGINVCYPPQHQPLAQQIVKNGCVLTEYPPNTKAFGNNFPKRNRIISALSSAVLVVEGPERSGALITGRCAKEQKRALYALPGNVESKNSYAPNLLLKEGAKMCTRAEDILNDFVKEYPSIINVFALKDRLEADMMSVLSEYRVSATCPEDDIFSFPRPFKRKKVEPEPAFGRNDDTDSGEPDESFDKETLGIYKRIPRGEGCSIESLITNELPLKILMKHLLKLEMEGFVVMLPGEMVARKFK